MRPAAPAAAGPRRRLSLAAAAALLVLTFLNPLPASADSLRDKQYWLEDYGITEAWKTSQGEGVRVAVIDTGVDASHPDLAGAVAAGTDVSGAGAPSGSRGLGSAPEHGTLVATMLAGRGHGGSSRPDGIIGVAPKAELLVASAWIGGANPAGKPIEVQIPEAVRWAVDNGADVINLSLGSTSTSWPQSWDDAFLYAEQQDVVVVAAAGNRGVGMVQVGAPATIPGVLTVAGLDRSGRASWDSSSEGISIGVAAPAEDLVGGMPDTGSGRYARWSGSSAAAPIVAGVAALIRSAYPQMSAAEVVNRIVSTARDAGAPGVDTLYGYGVLDAEAALEADVPPVTENPLGTIEEWIRVHRRGAPSAPVVQGASPLLPPSQTVSAPEVPQIVEPDTGTGNLPALLVLGFSGLLVLVAAVGALRVRRVIRGSRKQPDAGTFGEPGGPGTTRRNS